MVVFWQAKADAAKFQGQASWEGGIGSPMLALGTHSTLLSSHFVKQLLVPPKFSHFLASSELRRVSFGCLLSVEGKFHL